MATSTGDPDAELLALLREHCPDCADELLAAARAEHRDRARGGRGRRRAGSAARAAVAPSRSATSRGRGLHRGRQPAGAGDRDRAVGGRRHPRRGISALLIDITDPFRALIMAAYEILKDIISDFLGSGAYVYCDGPGLVTTGRAWSTGCAEEDLPLAVAGRRHRGCRWGRPTASAPGRPLSAVVRRPGRRPPAHVLRRGPGHRCLIVATAPQLPDLARFGSLFKTLLDTSKFEKAVEDFIEAFPEWPDDPDRSRLRSARWPRTGGPGGCATSARRTIRWGAGEGARGCSRPCCSTGTASWPDQALIAAVRTR